MQFYPQLYQTACATVFHPNKKTEDLGVWLDALVAIVAMNWLQSKLQFLPGSFPVKPKTMLAIRAPPLPTVFVCLMAMANSPRIGIDSTIGSWET